MQDRNDDPWQTLMIEGCEDPCDDELLYDQFEGEVVGDTKEERASHWL